MADRVQTVLDYIVNQYVVRDEQKEVDLHAAPSESGADIEADKKVAVRREADRADDLADSFRRGLVLAHQARANGQDELSLDDRDPEQNQLADALISFLVRYDLAASETEEIEPLHYRYLISVDWDRLGDVARAADVDLDRALQESGI